MKDERLALRLSEFFLLVSPINNVPGASGGE